MVFAASYPHPHSLQSLGVLGTVPQLALDGTSPLLGVVGRGCGSPDIVASPPPPLIPPHKGEGVDWNIRPNQYPDASVGVFCHV